ncbi:MAG: hypothetical protein ACOY4O_18595 [Pseudomonadota bacterium]
MRSITDFSDERNKAWCIHCTRALHAVQTNRDHVPTKGLLRTPLPENVPVIPVCVDCNNGFSADEEYTIAFLGCVLSGSTEPSKQRVDGVAGILERNTKLRQTLEKSRREYKTAGGETRTLWEPDQKRIERVIVKNARGHVFFELGEPMLEAPSSVWCAPFEGMSRIEREQFEQPDNAGFWPEVGSRMLTRVVTGYDLAGGWVVVQPNVYRYAVGQAPVSVRIVIQEYLAAEVCWGD